MSLFLQIKVPSGILSIEQHESLSDVDIDVKELHMKKILIQYGLCALAVALMAPLAQAQPAGIQAAFGKDAGTLFDKFTGLARVMSGKYDWKPGQGVRSVGDVFNLIVTENRMLVGVLSGTPNAGAKPSPISDPEKLQEAQKASYVNLQKASGGLSDNDLQAPVKLLGRDMTKQGALMLIIEDQQEHLGQSIAYARSNGVVSLNARAQDERQYTEGPVTFVQEIAVEYGHFEEYIDWLNSTWKPTMEATKKAGIIIDYKVFSATPQSPDHPSIILWITYKNMAALDRGVEEEAIAQKVIGSTEVQNKARVARNEYRKVLRRYYIRELILK
jgi:uncharacterized damage-inducible protein DinB